MRRALFLLAAITAIAVTALAPSAVANGGHPPERTTFEFEGTFVSANCPFPVQVHQIATVVRKDFFDSDGTLIERHENFPVAIETLTNMETGKSITLDTSGPAKWFFYPDGSIVLKLTGSSTVGVAWPDLTKPGMAWIRGRAELKRDATGTITLESWHGKAVDLCAELAAPTS